MEKTYDVGDTISFRLPNDLDPQLLTAINRLKEKEGRGFSKKVAQLFLEGLQMQTSSQGNLLLLPLPNGLSSEQQDWLQQEFTKQFLVGWLQHLFIQQGEGVLPVGPAPKSAPPANPSKKVRFQPQSSHTQRLIASNLQQS